MVTQLLSFGIVPAWPTLPRFTNCSYSVLFALFCLCCCLVCVCMCVGKVKCMGAWRGVYMRVCWYDKSTQPFTIYVIFYICIMDFSPV